MDLSLSASESRALPSVAPMTIIEAGTVAAETEDMTSFINKGVGSLKANIGSAISVAMNGAVKTLLSLSAEPELSRPALSRHVP